MKFKRLLLYIVFICATSILLISPVFSSTYYVKNGGNDGADGLSDANAWATVAKVNDYAENPGFSDGDVIQFKRGSTFSDETLGYDGSTINWGTINGLTFRDYGTGSKPRFDGDVRQPICIIGTNVSNLTIMNINLYGSGSRSSWLQGSAIYVRYVTGITIDGVDGDGRGSGSPAPKRPDKVIFLLDEYGDIEIKNCNIHDWGPAKNPDPEEGDTYALDVKTSSYERTYPNSVSIHDNTFYNIQGDAIQNQNFQGSPTNTMDIYDNTLYNCGENAIDIKNSTYVNIYRNTMYRNNWGSGGSGGPGPLVVIHSINTFSPSVCDKISIYENYFNGNYDGIYTRAGIYFNTGGILNVSIYKNRFENVSPAIYTYSGAYLIEQNIFWANKPLNVYDSKNMFILQEAAATIQKNTFYSTSDSTIYSAIKSNNARNSKYKDNIIFVDSTSTATYAYPLYVAIGSGQLPKIYSNDIHNPSSNRRVKWNGTKYNATDLSAWRNSVDNGALFADPLFKDVTNGNFSLLENSPCLLPDRTLGADQADSFTFLSVPNAPDNLIIKIK